MRAGTKNNMYIFNESSCVFLMSLLVFSATLAHSFNVLPLDGIARLEVCPSLFVLAAESLSLLRHDPVYKVPIGLVNSTLRCSLPRPSVSSFVYPSPGAVGFYSSEESSRWLLEFLSPNSDPRSPAAKSLSRGV